MNLQIKTLKKTMGSLKKKAELKSQKRIAKKNELASSTLTALGQLGYARAGLRDIAALSNVSLGVIHYYFEDKNELVSYAINLYKQQFLSDLDEALSQTNGRVEIINKIVATLLFTIEEKAEIHRLWYDFRAQAMFVETFHNDVRQIEQSLMESLVRHLNPDSKTGSDPLQLYIAVDGVFRYYTHKKLMGDTDWQPAFEVTMRNILEHGFSPEI